MSTSAIDTNECRAVSVAVGEDSLMVQFLDGRTLTVPLAWYPRLWHGSTAERSHFEIIGEGEYLHWPDLDEDLTIAGMLAGRRSGESPASLTSWLEKRQASTT